MSHTLRGNLLNAVSVTNVGQCNLSYNTYVNTYCEKCFGQKHYLVKHERFNKKLVCKRWMITHQGIKHNNANIVKKALLNPALYN